MQDDGDKPYFNIADYVEVQKNMLPRMNRPFGRRLVVEVRGFEVLLTLNSVKYVLF